MADVFSSTFFSFRCDAGQHPVLTDPNGDIVTLEVYNFVPYLNPSVARRQSDGAYTVQDAGGTSCL